jgi:4-hydroxy-tetrahydrodipicolinate synthase
MTRQFTGLSVALATPFREDFSLDLDSFRRLTRHVAEGGAETLVVLGTTGESPALSETERDALIETCLEEAQGCAVVAGTGSNDTQKTAAWTRRAQALGADGALIVTPYYNKPTPRGLVAHFAEAACAAPGLPIIVYNVPGRTGLNLSPAVLARLWENPQVVAIKESTANLAQIGEIARTLPAGKTLLSGDDNMALPSIAVGASGLVSVLGNLLPAETKALVDAALRGDLPTAQRLHYRLLPLMDALFLESSPVPLKAALRLMGLSGDTLRLPLVAAESATVARLADALRAAGVTLRFNCRPAGD